MKLTKQEMFNRAYRGLYGQSWKRCVDEGGSCVYNGPNGTHCAWGHVDPSITKRQEYRDITTLRRARTGLARTLDDDQFDFARELQSTHDESAEGPDMRQSLRMLAREHKLKIPTVRK